MMVRGRPGVAKMDGFCCKMRVMPMMMRVMLSVGLRVAQYLRYRWRDHAQQDREHPE